MHRNTSRELLRTQTLLSVFVLAPSLASAAVPAFPGAQGGGAVSVGGRGGAVIEVKNLNDSGPGSFRACVTASGPRTCVFRVGGTIELLSQIEIYNPYLTVAGQTAPGGGILLSGKTMAAYTMIDMSASDVIWRYMRIRKGWHPAAQGENTNLGATLIVSGGASNVIIDHVSNSWNQDDVGNWNSGDNGTWSYNLIAEGLADHSTGFINGGTQPADIDYHHNLTMNNGHRNPLLLNTSTRFVNNIIYNTRLRLRQISRRPGTGPVNTDIVGNYFKKGPMNTGLGFDPYEIAPTTGSQPHPSLYVALNKGFHQPDPNGDQWLMVRADAGENNPPIPGPAPLSLHRTTPLADTTYPIVAEPVANVEESILPIVGASRRLACDGTWVDARDSVDTRLINQYRTETGIAVLPETEDDVGGFPTIEAGTPCADADHDGMPDEWEMANGLDPNSYDDVNQDKDGDEYTNLEEYLAGNESYDGGGGESGSESGSADETGAGSEAGATSNGDNTDGANGTTTGDVGSVGEGVGASTGTGQAGDGMGDSGSTAPGDTVSIGDGTVASTESSQAEQRGDAGCGCRSTSRGDAAAFALTLLLYSRGRRTRRC